MSVLSVSFIALLIGVFVFYYLCPQQKRWIVLLAASMIFYLAASAGSIIYILITSVVTYISSRLMQQISDQQKAYFKENKLNREEKAAIRKQNTRKIGRAHV